MNKDQQFVSRIEDDPIAKSLPSRSTFIPLRHFDLKQVVRKEFELNDREADKFFRMCTQLHTLFHVEHQESLRRLEELYELLDPDTQLVEVEGVNSESRRDLGDHLIDCVSGLLFSAHYKRLSEEELQRAIDVGWNWGVKLEVNFDLFDRLEIFARGYTTITITRRRWQNFFRLESIELPEFTRLIMAFRIKESDNNDRNPVMHMLDHRFVYLKTFKNIPETEVEILLPGTRVRLTRFDRAKILFPTISGMAITGYKLFRSALLLTLAFSWQTWFGVAVLVGGAVGYIVKSVMSYFRTKKNYQHGLTRNLYLKNLDNNLSVLYRILNEAEEQEVSEIILAYSILWKHPDAKNGVDSKELDELVESFIRKTVDVDVDFEVHDALGKLARLHLASVDGHGKWRCIPIDEVESTMKTNWNQLFDSSSQISNGATKPN
ncbi:MAG: DUF3754 domain-containing protein [Planctomycetota bacterium]